MQSSSSRPLRRACEKWSGFHLARLTPSLWKGIVRGIQSVVGKGGRKKRDKITTLCLSSKSSGGVEVFQMKLEPWQLQMMSLFCHKSPQLPSGTDRSELMGLSTPWKVAAAVIGGSLMTDHRLSGERTGGYVLLSENGPSLPFPSIPFPSQRMQVIHPSLLSLLQQWFLDLCWSFCTVPPWWQGKG